MSVDFGWRRFNFFDKNIVLDPQNPEEKFLGLKDVCVDCWCGEGESVYLGEVRGGVFRLTRHLEEYYWKAYQLALADIHLAQRYMFSVGEDDDTSGSILKVWEEDAEGKPTIKRTLRLSQISPSPMSLASSLAVHSHLGDTVIGFADGTVLLYQGDVIKDKASRWIRVREASPLEGPVTGLALARLPAERLVVFVITTKAVYSYVIENKTVVNKLKHDASGASRDCWTFDERLGLLVVASRDMVYLHDAEQCAEADGGRGRCYQLGRGHEKLQLVAAAEYLVLLTKQHALIPSSETEFMSMVTVYDVKGQYIAFSCSLPSLCRVFTVGGSLMILSKDGTLSELSEKNLNAKLDILFKKNLFDVAVGVAKGSKDGQTHLKEIHAKYGDYLYGKGDFDNAISEYKETIGMLQPSYVIKKFHDDSRLRQLCVYLEALHDAQRQNGHHTAILLHCYARLAEKAKMLAFIEKMKADTEADMGVAFQVLRSNNMSAEASILATKLQLHDEALAAMVEDMGRCGTAIKYIARRPPKEACKYIERYGRVLFEKCPDEVMELLVMLLEHANEQDLDPSQLLSVFLGDSEKSAKFIEFALEKVTGDRHLMLLETILELRLRSFAGKEVSDSEYASQLAPLVKAANPKRSLQLARMFDCQPAIEEILMKSGRTKELLQHYMKSGKLAEVISLCKTANDKDMWLDALVFVSKMGGIVDEAAVQKLLKGVEEADCVHPLVVLEILSRSATLKVSVVKEFVINWLEKQEKQISADRKTISDGERRMEDIDKHIESLKFNVQVLQVNKCCACDTALQLPAVHFLCKHSYHKHCFESYAERPDKCPACTTTVSSQHQALSSVENFTDKAAYAKFQQELNSSVNSMDLIAKYLRMGLFDNTAKPTARQNSTPSSSRSSTHHHLDDSSNPFYEPPSHPSTRSDRPSPRDRPSVNPSQNPFETTSSTKPAATKKKPKESRNPFAESTNPFDE